MAFFDDRATSFAQIVELRFKLAGNKDDRARKEYGAGKDGYHAHHLIHDRSLMPSQATASEICKKSRQSCQRTDRLIGQHESPQIG